MKVLIPIDGSECSNKTLAWACQTLDPRKTQIYLLYVIPQGALELVTEEYQIEDALSSLKQAEQLVQKQGGTVAKAEFVEGDPADVICRYARETGVDEILMGSHGRTGLERVLLGSVSSAVLEHSDVPVFVYKNLARKKAGVK